MNEQKVVCKRYGVDYYPASSHLKVGVSLNLKNKTLQPINGLRHTPEGDTTGWYIWAGEIFSEDVNFFMPIHVEHLQELNPDIIKYLGLPPGYRFLIDDKDYEDVWEDLTLL